MIELKYLYTILFDDNSSYQQSNDDVSIFKEKGSAFSDVCFLSKPECISESSGNGIGDKKLSMFILHGNNNTYAVSLEDGHFEVNGAPFHFNVIGKSGNYKLYYNRRHTHVYNQTEQKEISHDYIYVFGWQCNAIQNGKEIMIEQLMVIDEKLNAVIQINQE